LIHAFAIRPEPRSPLIAIHRPQLSVLISPFIPDSDTVFFQIGDVRFSFQKPQQLVDDGSQVQFFDGKYRKPYAQIKAHLISETPQGSGAGTVAFLYSVVQNVIQ